MNQNPNLADARPLQIAPATFLAAFHPGPYCLRTFCDGGGGGGRNYRLSAAELPLEQQYENLLAFPLPPSIIVKTRKSLHGYWLLGRSEVVDNPNEATDGDDNSG